MAALPSPAWNGRIAGVDLYFDPKVDFSNAIAAVTNLLPQDAQRIRSVAASNSDWSTNPTGGCLNTMYTSDSMANVLRQADPRWSGDPHLISVVFYSGNTHNDVGSDHVYEPTAIHLALIGLGDSISDKDINC
jgi:hypothetical protein